MGIDRQISYLVSSLFDQQKLPLNPHNFIELSPIGYAGLTASYYYTYITMSNQKIKKASGSVSYIWYESGIFYADGGWERERPSSDKLSITSNNIVYQVLLRLKS